MKMISLIVSLICTVFLLWGCASYQENSYGSIKAEFEEFKDQSASSANMSNEDRAQKFALLCEKIADGNPDQASKYAELFREMIGNAVEFEDSEVFDLAENYASVFTWLADGNEDYGIQSIAIAKDNQGQKALQIEYIDVRGYRIKPLTADDMEYQGDHLIPYDGSLGQYRLEVTFFDTYASDELVTNYPLWEVHAFSGETIKFKCCTTPDHGFVIYIGSDRPFTISEEISLDLIYPMDRILIPLP